MAHPAARQFGVELGLAGQFIDLARRHLGRAVRRPNVVASLLFHLLANARVLLTLIVVQLVLAPLAFLIERHPLDGINRVADERLVARFMAAGEHAIERVVIRYRDGVVLVIVAAGTTDSQPHHTAGHHVDPVVYDVVRVVQKTPPQREETHRGQRLFVIAQFQFVGGHLLDDEPVVRQVGVEGVDHIIAISVRVGEEPRLVSGEVTLGVGVTRHVEPVTPPTLTKTRRGQHPLDEPPISPRRVGGHEGIHLPGRRWQAGQVEGHPAN